MDETQFDDLARSMFTSSRRRAIGAAIGAALISATGSVVEGKRKKKKKKKKGKGKKRCDSYQPIRCGNNCCSKSYPVCCEDPSEYTGSGCFEINSVCCPIEYGGGACYGNETCCPPGKGEIRRNCINQALGVKCCPPNSGGACDYDEDCCPPEFTNSNNDGCCEIGQKCCNFDSDCNTAADEYCSGGCCYS